MVVYDRISSGNIIPMLKAFIPDLIIHLQDEKKIYSIQLILVKK